MAPRNTGPSLSAGFLKHLGVEAKDSEGRKRRTGVQNRKEQRKESRAKSRPQAQPNRRPPNRPTPNRPTQSKPHGAPSQQQCKSADAPANGKPKGKSAPLRVVNPELEDDSIDEDDFDDDIDISDDEGLDEDEDEDEDNDEEEDEDAEDDDDEDGDEEEEEEDDTADTPAATAPKITGRMRERLEKDDAEIAELERKLGMKGRKSLPQSFKDDGLDDLLESLGGGTQSNQEAVKSSKRKAEADAWLQAKRQKALGLQPQQKQPAADDDDDDDEDDEDDEDDRGEEDDEDDNDDDFGGFSDSDASEGESGEDTAHKKKNAKEQPKRQRENPYVAPVSAEAPQKYIPPALRRAMQQGTDSESEAVQRVRRQAHHLIARLSDANMLTILGEVEKLYLENPRQYVTDAVTDKLLEQIQIDGALSSNVTVLIAGFATAVYMVKGTDFGAHFIQQNATAFKQHYDSLLKTEAAQAARDPEHREAWAPASKIAINLFSLMAELYNFRMIGPNLIYDYIRMLLSSLTETNTELLLRVFETSGTRLRQDDPRSLKDIVSLIQPAVVKAGGEKTLSVRTRHMIDRITDIKKSDKKKQRDAESSGFGHAERIRKVLGNLPTSRKLEAAGPLRVSLADIEQSDKRGKWWLVGASWAGRDSTTAAGPDGAPAAESTGASKDKDKDKDGKAGSAKSKKPASSKAGGDNDDDDDVLGSWGNDIADVEELDLLAREQGMNTDARRSIFVTLLSAADSKDAHARLLRLRLNKHERREIANVLIRCVGSEQTYNRYYALVARQVCSHDRRMGWVFQAALWKLFRRAGEQMFGEVPDSDDEADDNDDDLNGNSGTGDDATSLRRIVNTAKLFGYLIASGTMSLDTLKCLSLIQLQTKIRMFVEVLLLSIFEETHKAAKASGMDASAMIKKRFHMSKDRDDLRRGLQYFIDKVVRKSAIVDKDQKATIAKACNRAQKALRESDD